MEISEISILRMGDPRFNIDKVVEVINNHQNQYKINHLDDIPNIGYSDLEGFRYSDKLLFDYLSRYLHKDRLIIGITSVGLQNDWWIRPNADRSAMLVTIYQTDLLIEKANKTIENFLIFKILTCILSSEYFKHSKKSPRNSLIHDDCRECLFDFCPDKFERWRALKRLQICTQCKGNLHIGNVSKIKVDSIESVMNYMKKPTLKKIANLILKDPYLSGIIGIGLGIMVNMISNYLFAKGSIIVSVFLIIICILGPLLYRIFTEHKFYKS